MALFNRFQADVIPRPGGPLIVQSPNAGASGRAMAGLGRQMKRRGEFITAEGKEAEEKTAALERARQASKAIRTHALELDDYTDSLASNPDIDTYQPQLEAIADTVGARIEAIDDDAVRTKVQLDWDDRYALYHKNMQTFRQSVRIRNFEAEYTEAADAAIKTADVSLVQHSLATLVENNLITETEAADRLAEVNDKTAIWGRAFDLGWKEGLAYINDPATWKNTALEPDDIADLKAKIQSNFQTAQAIAATDDRKAAAAMTRRENELLGAAYGQALTPEQIAGLPDRIAAGDISAAVGKQVLELARKGPPAENDPDVLRQAYRLLDGIERGTATSREAEAFLTAHASKLIPSKRDSLLAQATDTFGFQNRQLTASRRYAVGQLTTVDDSMMERLLALGTDAEKMGPIQDKRAFESRLVEYCDDQLRTWLRDHPEATSDDIAVQNRRLVHQVRSFETAQRQSVIDAWEARDTAEAERYNEPSAAVQTPVPAAAPAGPEVKDPHGVLKNAPQGLESIWDRMSETDKTEAYRLMARGYTPEQIVEGWQP